LDADVIIHFEEGGYFSTLLDIFPEYEYIVLDVVYRELRHDTCRMIDNSEAHFNKPKKVEFVPTGDSRRDYAVLKATKGAGESASMIYCRDNRDVLGSSNLRDIREFCELHDIPCLTTLDFLHYAFVRKKMTEEECKEFMAKVKLKGHKLPEHITDIERYTCKVNV
jgi:hypothetical protein